jgi:hypothetical protein
MRALWLHLAGNEKSAGAKESACELQLRTQSPQPTARFFIPLGRTLADGKWHINSHYPTQAKRRLEWGTQHLSPVWPKLWWASPGFPVELVGVGELHAVPASRDRTRESVWSRVQEIRVAHLFRPTYAPRHAGAGLANVGHPSRGEDWLLVLFVCYTTARPFCLAVGLVFFVLFVGYAT